MRNGDLFVSILWTLRADAEAHVVHGCSALQWRRHSELLYRVQVRRWDAIGCANCSANARGTAHKDTSRDIPKEEILLEQVFGKHAIMGTIACPIVQSGLCREIVLGV